MIKYISIALVFFSLSLYAQQTESYTQFIFNQFALNPALAGTAECPDIKIGGRYQWIGMEGAPSTKFVSVHGALKSKKLATDWHGIGAYVIEDKAGLFSRTQINLAYAYHLKLSRKVFGSAGFYLGIRNQKLRGLPASLDPLLSTSKGFYVFPDVSVGGLLYTENSYIGVSAKQVFKRQNKGFGGNRIGENAKSIIQYYISAGTQIKSKVYIYTYKPAVLVKYGNNAPVSLEGSLVVYGNKNIIGMGVNVRMLESIAGILELKITRMMRLGYSYDFPISKIRKGTFGSHEIVLKIDPCVKRKSDFGGAHCPVF
jgi:type IX secretion system PorP/SprF family membrane protein